MTKEYQFTTDEESRAFCDEVVEIMKQTFGIADEEAVGRMNRLWKGGSFLGPEDMLYHEEPDYWAHNIYYGADSRWWLGPTGLKPLPFP
ncbi:MAG: hypothetical protein ABI599_14420 [Flavobacteriales bacterium]